MDLRPYNKPTTNSRRRTSRSKLDFNSVLFNVYQNVFVFNSFKVGGFIKRNNKIQTDAKVPSGLEHKKAIELNAQGNDGVYEVNPYSLQYLKSGVFKIFICTLFNLFHFTIALKC